MATPIGGINVLTRFLNSSAFLEAALTTDDDSNDEEWSLGVKPFPGRELACAPTLTAKAPRLATAYDFMRVD